MPKYDFDKVACNFIEITLLKSQFGMGVLL